MPRRAPPTSWEKRVAVLCVLGRCVRCGKSHPDLNPDSQQCPGCREQMRDSRRCRRADRAGRGLCTECGKRPPSEGTVRCRHCLARARKLARSLYALRKRLGLCTDCGRAANCAPHTICARCRRIRAERNARRRAKAALAA